MFDLDNWQELFGTLRRNKLRSFLTAFGVFWGIFMLVVMLGAGRGLQNGATRGFTGFATNSFFLWAQSTSVPYKGFKSGREFDFENDDIEALKKNVPECEIISARNQKGDFGNNSAVTHGTRAGSFQVLGDFPQFLQIQPVKKLEGRFINPLDIRFNRKVAVIGKKVVETLFGKDTAVIGQSIGIAGIPFLVVGVIRTAKSKEDETLESIYLPFTTFQRTFNMGKRVGWFSITSKEGIPCSITEEKAMKVLAERHSISPEDKSAIGHWNKQEQFNKMQNLFTGIRMLVWIVGTGTLLAGIIGVSNIMLIVVRERTREIGIKRAIGASPRVILLQILSESVFLTLLAGYFGLISGIFLMEGISSQLGEEGTDMFVNPSVDLFVALTSMGILVMGGLLAGLIPALRAIRIQTVEALRAE
jgi:putative ABC transport system permease protein